MKNYVFEDSEEALNRAQSRKILSTESLLVRKKYDVVIDPRGEYNGIVTEEDNRYKKLYIESQKQPRINTIIYLGYMLPIWGHVLTDSFKKLWFLNTPECKKLVEEGAILAYITRDAKPLIKANLDVWGLAEIPFHRFVHIDKPLYANTIYDPMDCFNYGIDADKVNYTKEYLQFVEKVRQKFYSGGIYDKNDSFPIWPQKIYFSRTGFNDVMKRDYGEKDLVRVFRKLGYTIVCPEKMSVVEQIGLVAHCDSFVSTEGSISHISLFCRPRTEVVILRKCKWVNGYQIAINEIANLDVKFIDAHKSDNLNAQAPYFGPFYLCINHNIEKYIGHRILHIPCWLRPSWWWYMNKNRKIVKIFCK